MATPKTFVNGGNRAEYFALATYSDALGTSLLAHDKITGTSKTGRPEFNNFALAVTHANLTSQVETFYESNLVQVASTEPVTITYEDNTVDSVNEVPSAIDGYFLLSFSGVVDSNTRRLYVGYGYISEISETDNAANTPVTITETFTTAPIPGQYTLTKAKIDALISDWGYTIATDIVLATGEHGTIKYVTK